ncbi:MAG: CoA-binding protein [Goleter apudmare HA4340-LM2]|jgi:hypothetical protein|nr:CoA-binding protein [Goleter apudmare HA4340-LM2]
MPDLKNDDHTLRSLLASAKTIAVVSRSDKRQRTSYQIAQFLRQVGYIVYPVNPLVTEIDGQPCYASLQDVPQKIDIVNVFRRSEYLPAIVEEAMPSAVNYAINAKTVWAQLGIWEPVSAKTALDARLNVIMDACIKIEYLRLKVS